MHTHLINICLEAESGLLLTLFQFTVGVYFSLKGVLYPNNSVIAINDIGESISGTCTNNGLQCITDKKPCCQLPNREGEWFFPGDGERVPPRDMATTFYRNRGNRGNINLNRVNKNVLMPTGRFCCEVSDATSSNVKACVTIAIGEYII